jgi:CspA family cold shock protein
MSAASTAFFVAGKLPGKAATSSLCLVDAAENLFE